MVRKNTRVIRADPSYFEVREHLKKELPGLTDRKITRGISRFLVEEDLLPVIVKREKRNRRRRLFW